MKLNVTFMSGQLLTTNKHQCDDTDTTFVVRVLSWTRHSPPMGVYFSERLSRGGWKVKDQNEEN